MTMRNPNRTPTHPGAILRDDVLPALGLSVTGAARELGVSRVALSRVLHGHAAMSADMALRVAEWLGHTPQSWLNMQAAYDLWHASKKQRPRIRPAGANVDHHRSA